jgi:excisionase family DNA binding protein
MHPSAAKYKKELSRSYYSTNEAAFKLGVHRVTVKRLADRGVLKSRRFGKRLMIEAKSVDGEDAPAA